MINLSNKNNLKPLSTEKAREIGSKGGKKSVEVRRMRKSMREQMEMLLSMPFGNKEFKERFEQLGFDTSVMDNQTAMLVAMYQKATNGDTQAFNAIREVVGERVQEIKVSTSIDEKVKELNTLLENIKDE